MLYATERTLAARARVLGESADAAALPELVAATRAESPLVRRIGASALGKLAGVVEATAAVSALRPLLADAHPQVRQYAAKALGAFGTAAEVALPALRDLLRSPAEADYVKRSVTTAGVAIKTALGIAAKQTVHACRRCGKAVAPDEYARSQRFFERTLCDICFDTTATERRNFEYWGMDTPRYKAGMYLKQDLYMQAGKKLISLYPDDRPRLDTALRDKLARISRADVLFTRTTMR